MSRDICLTHGRVCILPQVDSVLQRAFFSKVWEDPPHSIWYLNKLFIPGLPSAFLQCSSRERGTYRRWLPAVPDSQLPGIGWDLPPSWSVLTHPGLNLLCSHLQAFMSFSPENQRRRKEGRNVKASRLGSHSLPNPSSLLTSPHRKACPIEKVTWFWEPALNKAVFSLLCDRSASKTHLCRGISDRGYAGT